MCAAGAQYCFERKSSERLFQTGKAIVFERLRLEKAHFSPQTMALVSSSNDIMSDVPPTSRRTGPWSPLDMAKTLLILVGFATWERTGLLQQAFALRGLLVQALRDIGLQERETCLGGTSSRSAMWDNWVQNESARRTKLVAFCYINVHSIAYNINPLLWSSELHLRLPCGTQEWQAPSAAQWVALQRESKEEQMQFQQALSILLQSSTNEGEPLLRSTILAFNVMLIVSQSKYIPFPVLLVTTSFYMHYYNGSTWCASFHFLLLLLQPSRWLRCM